MEKVKKTTINHTAFHYRLNTINCKFFEQIYDNLVKKCKNILMKDECSKNNVLRLDSMLVDISSKLVKNIGFNQSGEQVKSKKVKFTLGYGEVPEIIKVFETKKHKSENIALKETILSKEIEKNQILLLDRGISDRKTFDKLNENNFFITRLVPGYKIEKESEGNKLEETGGW